jgi:D-alanine-D-alanine ligase
LHVALVYNLKREEQERGEAVPVEEERDDADTMVASRVETTPTRVDTYAEWDTEETIQAVQAALEQRHTVSLIEADEQAYQRLLAVQPDIVFNIAEGLHGPSREAQVPAMLEMLGIPYTGSDALTLGICLDKSRAKEILSYHNIPNPSFAVVSSMHAQDARSVPLPAIVKPLHEGSSKGIFNSSVVTTRAELERQVSVVLTEYREPALVERFLPGREFTVALLGNGANVRVFPIVEMRFDALPAGVHPIYSYEAKWIWDQLDHPIDVHEGRPPT